MNNNANHVEEPPLCANGCGFYGSPANKNLCSKCFNDSLKEKFLSLSSLSLQDQPNHLTNPANDDHNNNNNNNNDDVAVVKTEGDHVDKKKSTRCGTCKKRVGLTGFECKCGEMYCGSHRYPEMHSCQFNFKGVQREGLAKTLYSAAECKADKLDYRL